MIIPVKWYHGILTLFFSNSSKLEISFSLVISCFSKAPLQWLQTTYSFFQRGKKGIQNTWKYFLYPCTHIWFSVLQKGQWPPSNFDGFIVEELVPNIIMTFLVYVSGYRVFCLLIFWLEWEREYNGSMFISPSILQLTNILREEKEWCHYHPSSNDKSKYS